jgi:hypothetical protein
MLGVSQYMKFKDMSEREIEDWFQSDDNDGDEDWDVAKSLDVEAAFLNAPLPPEESVHIEIPEFYKEYCEDRGIEYPSGDAVFLLTMGQYGLVQVARAWVRRFTEILVGFGMKQCKTDPCLFVKHDENGRLILWTVIYIDDAIYGGVKKDVLALKGWIEKGLTISDIGDLNTHLGVNYKLKFDEMGPYFECDMTKYVKSMCEEFETHTGKRLKDYATPGAPGTMLLKNQGEMVDQSGYRKFVGKSLFAVKKLLPDCSNAV